MLKEDAGLSQILVYFSLKDYWVIGYLETQDMPPIDVRIFSTFPQEILCKHAVSLWVRGYEILCEKKDGHRR